MATRSDINVFGFKFQIPGQQLISIKHSWEIYAHARDLFRIQVDFHFSHFQGTTQAFLAKIAKSVQYFKIYRILLCFSLLMLTALQCVSLEYRKVKLRLSGIPRILMFLVAVPSLKPISSNFDSDDCYSILLHFKKKTMVGRIRRWPLY